jgi:DnaK suppressor protein
MKAEEVKNLKDFLQNQLERIKAHGDIDRVERDEREGAKGDIADHANFETNMILHMSLRDRDQMTADQIKKALTRIEAASFGECENCGDDIGTRRLRANPLTSLCVLCQEEIEDHVEPWRHAH